METIKIHSMKNKSEWYASFYVEGVKQNSDMTLPTPFFTTMSKQEVINIIQAKNPNKKVK